MSLPVVAPGEQVIEIMIPASKVGLIIGKLLVSLFGNYLREISALHLKSCTINHLTWVNSQNFAIPAVVSLGNDLSMNSILMMSHYPDIGSSSDCWKQISMQQNQSEALPRSG